MGQTIKVEHITPFIDATIKTFALMVYSEAKPGKVGLIASAGARFDVSGIIGLSGKAQGTVALSFPRITALKVCSAFVGARVLALDDIATDAIGELANIIAGAAKGELSRYQIQISLPTVILGDDHELAGPKHIVPMVVPFQCAQGNFNLVVRFKSES
ncbi:MAG: CheC domain protein [Fibrobacteres bacterium]|nr:CheC domain protein [Fibrobacterota bacterium]